jgi:hypothetical protein
MMLQPQTIEKYIRLCPLRPLTVAFSSVGQVEMHLLSQVWQDGGCNGGEDFEHVVLCGLARPTLITVRPTAVASEIQQVTVVHEEKLGINEKNQVALQ